MSRQMLLLIVVAGLLAAPQLGISQDDAPQAPEAGDRETTAEDTAAEQTAETESSSYIDAEEDDFRPTEKISLDHSISFPTDI